MAEAKRTGSDLASRAWLKRMCQAPPGLTGSAATALADRLSPLGPPATTVRIGLAAHGLMKDRGEAQRQAHKCGVALCGSRRRTSGKRFMPCDRRGGRVVEGTGLEILLLSFQGILGSNKTSRFVGRLERLNPRWTVPIPVNATELDSDFGSKGRSNVPTAYPLADAVALPISKVMEQARHASFETTRGYIREADAFKLVLSSVAGTIHEHSAKG
jgi:hypothetical protein